MKLYFVRHGKTAGNQEGRYVGRTDEPLLAESIRALRAEASEQGKVPQVELVVTSPMLRCRQTAEALYPGVTAWVQEGLEEMDFGEFEYKNYQELNGNPAYQAYIDSGGSTGFPGGEPLEAFKQRCRKAFLAALARVRKAGASSAAFVVHGGTIMAVLETWGVPEKSYFQWQIKNGERLEGEISDSGKIFIREGRSESGI